MEKKNLATWIVAVCAVLGLLLGAVPNAYNWIKDTIEKPELGVALYNSSSNNRCWVSVWNQGREDAENVNVSVMIVNNIGSIMYVNHSLSIPIIPEWNREERINFYSYQVEFDGELYGEYDVKAIVRCDGGHRAETKAVLEIV